MLQQEHAISEVPIKCCRSKFDIRASHGLACRIVESGCVQDSGDELAAFVYVWCPEFENMLDMVPWDFESFMEKDFQTYWAAEVDF